MLQPLYLQHSTERRCVSADLVIDKSINGPLAYHIKGFTYTNTSTGKKVCLQKIVLLLELPVHLSQVISLLSQSTWLKNSAN